MARKGHEVVLIDPELAKVPQRHASVTLTGTSASLGVLMGHVFRRSSGRAWRLRRRSMELWPQWAEALSTEHDPFTLHTPLLQLASSEEEAMMQLQLAEQRPELGLSFLTAEALNQEHPDWPSCRHGGLLSSRDGRVDPLHLQIALRRELQLQGVTTLSTVVEKLHQQGSQWSLQLATGETLPFKQVVICSGLASQDLLTPMGHARPMEPVLGQVLHLKLKDPDALTSSWPAVLMSHGVNVVRHGEDQLWLGATLEPGHQPDTAATLSLRALGGDAPAWLHEAEEIGRWHGLRARPDGRPAPLLEMLEPGLILASGHYRNGVLLAPATAEWVCQQIEA